MKRALVHVMVLSTSNQMDKDLTATWTPNVGNSGLKTPFAKETMRFLIADQDGCTQVINVTIGGPTEIIVQVDSDTNIVCIDGQQILHQL